MYRNELRRGQKSIPKPCTTEWTHGRLLQTTGVWYVNEQGKKKNSYARWSSAQIYTELRNNKSWSGLRLRWWVLRVYQDYISYGLFAVETEHTPSRRRLKSLRPLHTSSGRTTNQSALLWKQRTQDLSFYTKKFPINSTAIVSINSRLKLHWFHLQSQQSLVSIKRIRCKWKWRPTLWC